MIDTTKHAGDCTIFASLSNGTPESGICTCGLGWKEVRKGNWNHMYSDELEEKLKHDKFDECVENKQCNSMGMMFEGTCWESRCDYFNDECPVVKKNQT